MVCETNNTVLETALSKLLKSEDYFLRELGEGYLEDNKIPDAKMCAETIQFLVSMNYGCRLLRADNTAEIFDMRLTEYVTALEHMGYKRSKSEYNRWDAERPSLRQMIGQASYTGRIE